MSTFLITAATGKTGSPLTEQLIEEGHTVRAGTSRPGAASTADGAEVVAFDWHDDETWAPALDGASGVYLVTPEGMTTVDQHVAPFHAAMGEAGVTSVVQLSAAGVEHAPPEVHLRAAELLTLEGGYERGGVVRPSWFHQNFHASFFAPAIREEGVLRAAAGDTPVPFVDARDIAAVAAAMLTGATDDTEATVTGPEALSFAEAAEALSRGTGRQLRHEDLTPEEFRPVVAASVGEQYADTLTGLFAMLRQGATPPALDTVQRVTGHAPISLEQYARDHARELGA